MRPIKFRGKHHVANIWYVGHYYEQGVEHIITTDGYTRYVIDVSTLSQFTGLLDKNGKEIYEGDVVQCDVRIEGRVFKKARGEVLYADNVAAFCVMLDDEYGSMRTGPSTDGSRYALPMEQLRDFIIIGNLCEDPELLTH